MQSFGFAGVSGSSRSPNYFCASARPTAPIASFTLLNMLSRQFLYSSWGRQKPPRETTGRPRQPSVAAVCPCWRDQLTLLGTT